MKISANRYKNKKSIMAAGDEDFDNMFDDVDGGGATVEDPDSGIDDQLDDIADDIDEIQDQVDDIQEDDPSIDMDNNISNHYIAECDKCHGLFISAVIESDMDLQSINGVCPLCGKESEQFLKWIIRDVGDED